MTHDPCSHPEKVDQSPTDDATGTGAAATAEAATTADQHPSADHALATTDDSNPEMDFRAHAEMLSRLVADCPSGGLLVLRAKDADPDTGEESSLTLPLEECDIVNGVKGIRTKSRKIARQIVNSAEEMADCLLFHHLEVPLAIMDDELPTGRWGREDDIVGVLGVVAFFDDVADYDDRLPREPEYVLGHGDRMQAWYLFDEPALLAEAKPVATALCEQAGCEPATADLAHGWWMAGSYRYSPGCAEPVRVVKPWDGTSRTRLADLQEALGMATGSLGPEPDGWPKPLGLTAYHGLAGEVVDTLLPNTEADPAALLVHFLVAAGNALDRGPHAKVEADRHAGNLYAMFVGPTGAGRKAIASNRIFELLARADPDWSQNCVASGMSTGEGIIQALCDTEAKGEGNDEAVVHGHGVKGKRLFLREPELSRMFRAMDRRANTLSDVLRCAWDGTVLQSLTKEPLRATNPHISLAGDITVEELQRLLRRVELVNGFANRFLFVCTKRSKLLSHGGGLAEPVLNDLATKLHQVLEAARKIGRIERSPEARELWSRMYEELSTDRSGLLGAATSRAAAQVLRLSLIYALLDGSGIVRHQHLQAAREVWRYCEDSARYVLGEAQDPMAERLLDAIRNAGKARLSGTDVRDLFGRHASLKDINRTLSQLQAAGLITKVKVKTGGRPKTWWFATA